MEYKIGQVFEFRGKWYQFVEVNGPCCNNCVFNQGLKCIHSPEPLQCARFFRTDGKNGHVVLLDAIGGEYKQGNAIFRDYRCQTKPVTTDKRVYISNSDSEVGLIVSIRLTSSSDMERKIGEIFEYNGEWYQAVKSQGKCVSCDFMVDGHCIIDFSLNGSCFYCHRKDKEDVIFKRLQKVGEPFSTNILGNKVWEQRYRFYDPMAILNGYWYHIDGYFIDIEIKQTKEDMEERS